MSRKCKYCLMSGLRGCLACWPHHSDMSSVLAADLVPVTPLYPGIMSGIFEMSNVARGLSLLEKFQTSSTIITTSQELCFGDLVYERDSYKGEVMMHLMGSVIPDSTDILSIILIDYSAWGTDILR
ncbi:hypothetical protein HJG60_009363 [Phyllostomus discolor]|uniref:Uncharacterized protein n=1 Tax=Phyllostomus discolor TaxID=89673 RepID=A0A833YIP2_9CHIR|nr:hypothetical protein HJG60_009363 [Phyllostomus discolor]